MNDTRVRVRVRVSQASQDRFRPCLRDLSVDFNSLTIVQSIGMKNSKQKQICFRSAKESRTVIFE
jgi:hypothetical protein